MKRCCNKSKEHSEAFRKAAWKLHNREGVLEIDDEAPVSHGDLDEDGGAYVQAWVWVSRSEAGIEADGKAEPSGLKDAREAYPGGGGVTMVGLCGACGRKLGLSSANKTGVRCRFDGAQYDRRGEFVAWK